jgi:hypothetical protein
MVFGKKRVSTNAMAFSEAELKVAHHKRIIESVRTFVDEARDRKSAVFAICDWT